MAVWTMGTWRCQSHWEASSHGHRRYGVFEFWPQQLVLRSHPAESFSVAQHMRCSRQLWLCALLLLGISGLRKSPPSLSLWADLLLCRMRRPRMTPPPVIQQLYPVSLLPALLHRHSPQGCPPTVSFGSSPHYQQQFYLLDFLFQSSRPDLSSPIWV